MDPAEDEGKGHHHRDDTAPGQEEVRRPAQMAAPANERLQYEVLPDESDQPQQIGRQAGRSEEQLPAAPPVKLRRWFLQPDRISVHNPEGRKDYRTRVGDERRVEMPEFAGTDVDGCH